MSVIDLIVLAVFGLLIGMVYAYLGYELINLLTDDPKWRPWEQCIIWLFWPVILLMFLFMAIMFIAVGLLIPVLFVIGIIVNSIRKLFKK